MRSALLLLVHSLKRVRVLVLTMGILLSAFQVLMIAYANSIQTSGGFDQLSALIPSFLRDLLGPAMVGMMSFAGIVSFGYIDVPVIGALVAMAIALGTTPAAEVETGFISLILSRPLARHWIITRTIVLVILSTILLLAMMLLGTWGGLEMLTSRDQGWPSAKLIGSLAINLGLLTICWSAVAMAAGTASRRRSVAGGLVGLLALTTFLLDFLGRVWKPANTIAWLSPFRYNVPFDLLMGTPLPTKNLVVLGGIAAAGFVVAYIQFSRRDI